MRNLESITRDQQRRGEQLLWAWAQARVAVVLFLCLASSSCATLSGRPATALERNLAKCGLSLAGATLLGAGIGAVADGGDGAKKGAAIGAGAGGVLCIVLLALDQADQERVRQQQQVAIASGQSQREEYVGVDEQRRVIATKVRDADLTPSGSVPGAVETVFTGPCRYRQTHIDVEGSGSASLDEELLCRTSVGDWLPYERA